MSKTLTLISMFNLLLTGGCYLAGAWFIVMATPLFKEKSRNGAFKVMSTIVGLVLIGVGEVGRWLWFKD